MDNELAPTPTSPTEKALRASLSLLPTGVLVLDHEGVVQLAEGGVFALLGLDPTRLPGERLSESPLFPPWLRRAALEALRGQESTALGTGNFDEGLEALFRPAAAPYGGMRWVVGFVHSQARATAEAQRQRESEVRGEFEQLADLTEGVFWEADPVTLQFLHVSEMGERLLGFSTETWCEPHFWRARLHPEDRESTVAACSRAAAEGRPHSLEYRMIDAAGGTVWVRDYIAVAFDNGQPAKLRGVMLNITEVKQSQERLSRSNAQLAATLEATADGVLAVDKDGQIQSWNRRLVELWGVPLASPPPHSDVLFELIGPSLTDPKAFSELVRIQRAHPEVEKHDELLLKDGRIIARTCRPQMIGNDVVGRVWTFRDITARRRADEDRKRLLNEAQRARAEAEAVARRSDFLAEASRRLSESLDLETTLRTVTQIAIPQFADGGAAFLFSQGEFKQLSAAHRDPDIEKVLVKLFESYPPDPNAPVGMGRVIRTREPFLFRTVRDEFLQKLARTPEHLELLRALKMKSYLAVPMFGPQGTFGVLAFATMERTFDAADLELAEELGRRCGRALEHARMFQQTQRAIRLRDDFVAIASHELRTPLTPLKLVLSTLEARLKAGGAPPFNLIARAQRSVDRLRVLVNDLLDVSQLEAGRLELHLEDFSLSEAVLRMVQDFKDLSARHTLDATKVQSGISFHGDRNRINQVIANLLDNAIKYSPEGGTVGVQLSVVGGEAVLSVTDTGIGIPADQQQRLFERFSRASSAPLTRFGGLGLGLYICRNIVLRHGGRIWVDSEEGAGSTFYVALPLPK